MQEAYSRLKSVLEREHLTTADLVRRIAEQGDRVNPKSVYRLTDPEEPLEKVDMRVISAICQALSMSIGDILTFDEPEIIEQFAAAKQERMDGLLARLSGAKTLTQEEISELHALVNEAEEIARGNARRLANRRRRLLRSGAKPTRGDAPRPTTETHD
ncbi:MAG: helix-turn-helix transcriptional regulator [Capsulimonadaceae bacterium]|nr:helix-turn-helix transcriptional regulator [Capsulimonadaceae bacterium]